MKKVDAELSKIESAFGGNGAEVEMVPLIVPMSTYRLLLEAGKKQGITAADVVTRALSAYLAPKEDNSSAIPETRIDNSKNVAIIYKRRQGLAK